VSSLPTFYSVTEVAELLKVSIYAVYKLVAAGKVTPLRTPDTAELRFTAADVVQLLRALTPPPVPIQHQRGVRRNLVLVSG
jgi:excisionase family DNA binding protein